MFGVSCKEVNYNTWSRIWERGISSISRFATPIWDSGESKLALVGVRTISAPRAFNTSTWHKKNNLHYWKMQYNVNTALSPKTKFYKISEYTRWHIKTSWTLRNYNGAYALWKKISFCTFVDQYVLLAKPRSMQSSIFLCLSQARINWEGCDRKGIPRKNGGMMEVGQSLTSSDGMAPTWTVGVSTSVIFPCTIKSRRAWLAKARLLGITPWAPHMPTQTGGGETQPERSATLC